MAVGSEIVTKIKSVTSTRKVTTALEMVSASKIKKAQDQMNASRPYTHKIKQMIGHLAKATPEYKHPFMHDQEADRVGYIIISTDRGAVLVNVIGEDLLIVAVAGSPPDVGPAWVAIAAERAEIREAAEKLFGN